MEQGVELEARLERSHGDPLDENMPGICLGCTKMPFASIAKLYHLSVYAISRVETKMHFSIFAKMRKSCENGKNSAKFRFAKIFVFAIMFAKISRKFDSTGITACMVYGCNFFLP
jgi:hypothetical protein